MSSSEENPNRWDMPIKIGIIVIIAAGFFYFGMRKTTPPPAAAPPAPPAAPVPTVALPGPKPTHWIAYSSTAKDVTGDIDLSATTLVLNRKSYPLQATHTIAWSEMLPVENLFSTETPPGSAGFVYQTNIPATAKLLNKDTMCGAQPAQWIVSVITLDKDNSEESLYLGFFSGPTPPALTIASLTSGTNACGTFSYARKVKPAP